MNNKFKILVNEADTVFGTGLRVLLSSQPDLDVVTEMNYSSRLNTETNCHQPDMIICDIYESGYNNIEKIVDIKQSIPLTKVLLITHHKSEQAIRNALFAGVSGYVLKDASSSELLTAVRSVLEGKVYLSPSLSDNIINAFLLSGGSNPYDSKPRLECLTRREREILKMVAEGHTNRSVANTLSLSIKTVEKHRSNMMKKLDLHNTSALTSFAIGQGLVTERD